VKERDYKRKGGVSYLGAVEKRAKITDSDIKPGSPRAGGPDESRLQSVSKRRDQIDRIERKKIDQKIRRGHKETPPKTPPKKNTPQKKKKKKTPLSQVEKSSSQPDYCVQKKGKLDVDLNKNRSLED